MANWLLQGNPDRYDVLAELEGAVVGDTTAWSISRHVKDYAIGDRVALWVSGKAAGLYGLGVATGSPRYQRSTRSDMWKRPDDRGRLMWFAPFEWTRVLPDKPVPRTVLKREPDFKDALILRQPWGGNPFRLTDSEFNALTRAAGVAPSSQPEVADPDDDLFEEGRAVARAHYVRERSRELRRRKVAQVKRQTGRLACEACDFEFEAKYGPLGRDYIEVHHLAPLDGTAKVRLSLRDVAALCSNCHRMAHRKRPWADLARLRKLTR